MKSERNALIKLDKGMTIIKASLEEAGAGSYLLVIRMTVENIEG